MERKNRKNKTGAVVWRRKLPQEKGKAPACAGLILKERKLMRPWVGARNLYVSGIHIKHSAFFWRFNKNVLWKTTMQCVITAVMM
jgi:hypothetical protein